MIPLVRCYGCGREYRPTVENTRRHTHHFGPGPELRRQPATLDFALGSLDRCQAERDEYARLFAAAVDSASILSASGLRRAVGRFLLRRRRPRPAT